MAEDLAQLAVWQKALQPFDPVDTSSSNEDIQEYLNHYGLDFSDKPYRISHHLGYRELAGRKLSTHLFQLSEQKPLGYVFVLHGYTDHVGLYAHVINTILELGYSVISYDLPGHGLSEGDRAAIGSFEEYCFVLDEMITYFRQKLQGSFHIVAQSMGAAVAMDWLLQQQQKEQKIAIDKVVLFAPLVKPHGWRLGKIAYYALKTVKTGIDRDFGVNSEDESFLDFVKNRDPLQHERLPTQWVGALIEWINHIESLPECEAPLYIIQGRKDMTVDWKYNIAFIEHKFPNTMTHYISDAGHHLANESERLRKDIFAYLKAAFRE